MTAADTVNWVTPRLAVWGAYEPAVKCDLTSTALVTADGLVLIDPIAVAGPALESLLEAGRPCAIVLTNGNHARAAGAMRESLGVPVFAPRGALAELGIEPDGLLSQDAPAPGGLRVIALPSAGPGEVACLHDGVVVVGDALVNLASTGFALLPEKYCVNAPELPNELRKLLSYPFIAMTFAHGVPLTESARRRLEDLLA